MAYNLASPNQISQSVGTSELLSWFAKELAQVANKAERRVLSAVACDLASFVQWASEALLLWPESDRKPAPGEKRRYFQYPLHLREMAKAQNVILDGRPNGPAIASFLLAGGKRPPRFGSSNAWSIHHLYSGKFPDCTRQHTMHAAKEGAHFTQSAGLVAVHPVADAMVDEYPCFAWLLRAHSFRRFGYDPDGVFSPEQDSLGFAVGRPCRIVEQSVFMGSGSAPPEHPGMTIFSE